MNTHCVPDVMLWLLMAESGSIPVFLLFLLIIKTETCGGFQRGEKGVFCCHSVAQSCPTLCDLMDWTSWTAACQASLSFTISWSLLKLMSVESVMPSSYLIFCCPLFLPPSVFPASGSFPMSQLFTSGGQSIGASALASVLPMNIQG